MNQNSTPCKAQDQGDPSYTSLFRIPPQNLSQNMIPALYNYALIEYFLASVDSMSYNNRPPLHKPNMPRSPPQSRNFDVPISPKKFLKLNTFDGEKVKLEDAPETVSNGPKPALSEASTQEGSNSCEIPEGVNKNSLKEKNSQNPRKNLPGLVLQRIRTCCLTALENKNKALSPADEVRLKYAKDVFEKLNREEIENFQEYFKLLNKNWKTWKKVHAYIHGNEAFAETLQKVIEGFLCEEGSLDFNQWLTAGKMNPLTRQVLEKSKEWLVVKWREVFKKVFKENRSKKKPRCELLKNEEEVFNERNNKKQQQSYEEVVKKEEENNSKKQQSCEIIKKEEDF